MQQMSWTEIGVVRTMRGRIAHDDELGMRYEDVPGRDCCITMPAGASVDGGDGCVAEGALATLLDTVSGIGAMAHMDFKEAVATLDLRIDYLVRPPLGAPLRAMSEVTQKAGAPGAGSLLVAAEAYGTGASLAAARATGRFIRRPMPEMDGEASNYPSGPLREARDYAALMAFRESGEGRIVLPFRPGLVGNSSLPSLHGGAVAAHLQECGCRYLVAQREGAAPLKLVTAHFSFLRFGRAVDVVARPIPLRLGRGTATVEVDAFQDGSEDRPIARALLTFAAG